MNFCDYMHINYAYWETFGKKNLNCYEGFPHIPPQKQAMRKIGDMVYGL